MVPEKPFLKFRIIFCYQNRRFYHHECQKAVPDDTANFYTVFTEETLLHSMCLLFCANSQSPEGGWYVPWLFSCSSFRSLVFENFEISFQKSWSKCKLIDETKLSFVKIYSDILYKYLICIKCQKLKIHLLLKVKNRAFQRAKLFIALFSSCLLNLFFKIKKLKLQFLVLI